jgi:hypothetical protein
MDTLVGDVGNHRSSIEAYIRSPVGLDHGRLHDKGPRQGNNVLYSAQNHPNLERRYCLGDQVMDTPEKWAELRDKLQGRNDPDYSALRSRQPQ